MLSLHHFGVAVLHDDYCYNQENKTKLNQNKLHSLREASIDIKQKKKKRLEIAILGVEQSHPHKTEEETHQRNQKAILSVVLKSRTKTSSHHHRAE